MTNLETAMANVDEQMAEIVRTERPKIMLRQAAAVTTERATTHGPYEDTARVAQLLKAVLHASPNWHKLTPAQMESLEMLCTKQARILSGNPNDPDHWLDIAGYVTLIVEHLR